MLCFILISSSCVMFLFLTLKSSNYYLWQIFFPLVSLFSAKQNKTTWILTKCAIFIIFARGKCFTVQILMTDTQTYIHTLFVINIWSLNTHVRERIYVCMYVCKWIHSYVICDKYLNSQTIEPLTKIMEIAHLNIIHNMDDSRIYRLKYKHRETQ